VRDLPDWADFASLVKPVFMRSCTPDGHGGPLPADGVSPPFAPLARKLAGRKNRPLIGLGHVIESKPHRDRALAQQEEESSSAQAWR